MCGRAGAAVNFGVTEDAGKAGDAGVWFFSTLDDVGLTENRITIVWDPSAPTTINNRIELDAWMPQATLSAVQVIFAVVPARARDLTSTPDAPAKYAAFCALLAKTYPQVTQIVIGNEPNQPRFWQPQFGPDGRGVSATAYQKVLARSYDELKAVNPKISVIGVGLSPRGNDNPRAKDNVSISPVKFLRDLGAAYRASGRTKPLMDELAFHPYPRQNIDSPATGYRWPNVGLPNFGRLKQAFWDAFHGTPQPTFPETASARAAPKPVKLALDELGWEVAIPSSLVPLYHGLETKQPIDETTQARYYRDTVRMVVCDHDVRSFSFFHLMDEYDLERWQSGLLRADRSKRPSYGSVKQVIHDTQGKCAGKLATWKHTTTVIEAQAKFTDAKRRQSAGKRKWWFAVKAGEDVLYRAGLFRVQGAKATGRERSAIARTLAGRRGAKAALSTRGPLKHALKKTVRFARRGVRSGYYVYAVRMTAAMNPTRAKIFFSRPIQVGTPSRRSRR